MTTPSEELETGAITGSGTTVPPRVRASSADLPRSVPITHEEASLTTAEIPAVYARMSAREIEREGTRRRPRREPAPVMLRVLVWLLVLVCLIGVVGLAVEHFQPSWLSFLRYTNSANSSGSQLTTHTTSSSSHTMTAGPVSAKTAEFEVPYSTYSIVVSTTEPCYVVIRDPANSSSVAHALVLAPTASPKTFVVSGSSSIVLDAQAQAIAIQHNKATLGTIKTPKLGLTYTFVPTNN